MNKSLIAKDIHKSFPVEESSDLEVIKGISFEVNEAEIFGVVGESGAGKSTLINVVSTLDNASSGSVTINDQSIDTMNDAQLCDFRNKNLGFVFQAFHLLPEFDVIDNVLMPARVSNHRKMDREYANQLLEWVDLIPRKNYSIANLSGGEKQRVAVARSLMNRPKIVFCDEPTGNLDHKNTDSIFRLFVDLSKQTKTTFIVVSHSNSLKEYADRVIEIEDGLIKNGT